MSSSSVLWRECKAEGKGRYQDVDIDLGRGKIFVRESVKRLETVR
jgi:hypothetical protein